MYPLKTEQPFLRNAWYVVAWGNEIGDKPLARTILEEPIVLYRTNAGKPVALWGLCPHRLAPLDMGSIRDDTIVCPYHGFAFDADGECVDIPIAETRPPNCRLKSYPVIERGPFLWIWMGDPAHADLNKLPDASDIGLGDDSTGWRVDPGITHHLNARAQLLVDNLFDLTHLAFVHSNSAPAGSRELALARPAITRKDGRMRFARTMPDVPFGPDTLASYLLPEETGVVDFTLFTEMYNICLINACGPLIIRRGENGGEDTEIAMMNFIHVATPETRHSTHYFGAITRNFRIDDDKFSQDWVERDIRVRSEDVVLLEEIERRGVPYGDLATEVSVFSDAGALQIRGLIQRWFESEAVT